MAYVQSTAVNLFDEYCLRIPPKLKGYQNGPPGRRVMFITDQKENFNISFEEGMKAKDTISKGEDSSIVSYQYRQEGKYIHLQRRSESPILWPVRDQIQEDQIKRTIKIYINRRFLYVYLR